MNEAQIRIRRAPEHQYPYRDADLAVGSVGLNLCLEEELARGPSAVLLSLEFCDDPAETGISELILLPGQAKRLAEELLAGAAYAEARDEFDAMVNKKTARGLPLHKAIAEVVREHPNVARGAAPHAQGLL